MNASQKQHLICSYLHNSACCLI